jgi:hypothetical protein
MPTGEHVDEHLGRRNPSIDGREPFRLDNATGLLLDLAPEGVEKPLSSFDPPPGSSQPRYAMRTRRTSP